MDALSSSQQEKRELSQNKFTGIIDLIERSTELIPVSEICSLYDIPERTLRYTFQREIGLSPKAYMKRTALNGIRQELMHTLSEQKVIHRIAGRYGFWHMGQFASDYYELFGELPSDTKRRALS